MTIYLLCLFAIFVIGSLFNINKIKKRKIIFILFSGILLCWISMFRTESIGIDTMQYYNAFKTIAWLNPSQFSLLRYEYGFIYLCKTLSLISLNPQILIITTSLFINISILRFIYKNSDNIFLSVIFYILLNFFFAYMNIMRQALAISILLWGYEYLKRYKIFSYIIFVIIAMQFHSSAILTLVLIFFKKIKFNRKYLSVVFIFSLVAFFYGRQLFLFISSFSPRLYEYVGSEYDVVNYFGALLNSLLFFFLFIFGVIIIKNENKEVFIDKKNKDNILVGIMGLTCVLSILIMKVSIFNRFIPYFSIFVIIWLSNCLEKIRNYRNKIILTSIILVILFIYWIIIMIFRPEWYGVTPYKSIFS